MILLFLQRYRGGNAGALKFSLITVSENFHRKYNAPQQLTELATDISSINFHNRTTYVKRLLGLTFATVLVLQILLSVMQAITITDDAHKHTHTQAA